MQRVGSIVRGGTRTRIVVVSSAIAALTALSACTSDGGTVTPRSSAAQSPSTASASSAPSTSSSSEPAVSTAVITAKAVGGLNAANPAKPVSVDVTDGSLSSVSLVNASGKVVSGRLSDDGSTWTTTEPLGYDKTYSLTAKAADAGGMATIKRSKITTLTPNNMTMPYFNTVNGSGMDNGATYGVGMIVSVHFDEPIPDKKVAEKALTVSTTPAVSGAWYWLDNQNAHWRPRSYYRPGTKVSVDANAYGVDFGGGLYGQSDKSISFTVGSKRYAVANAKTHQVKVYFGDKLVRTMPTSMGRGGYVQGDNGPIALWTPPGTYTVITHENPAIMSSDSYGLPTNSPDGYGRLVVPWSTKISTDGIYLHQLDSTVYAQGSENLSHGCLNLNQANAKWFYNHSRVGDVVKVVKSGGPELEVWRGGDWSVPWATWVKGGAAA